MTYIVMEDFWHVAQPEMKWESEGCVFSTRWDGPGETIRNCAQVVSAGVFD